MKLGSSKKLEKSKKPEQHQWQRKSGKSQGKWRDQRHSAEAPGDDGDGDVDDDDGDNDDGDNGDNHDDDDGEVKVDFATMLLVFVRKPPQSNHSVTHHSYPEYRFQNSKHKLHCPI